MRQARPADTDLTPTNNHDRSVTEQSVGCGDDPTDGGGRAAPGAKAELANCIDHTRKVSKYRLFYRNIKTSIYNLCGNFWIPPFASMTTVREFRAVIGVCRHDKLI